MTSIASTRRHAITSGSSNLCNCRSATPCRLRNAVRATTGSGRDDRYSARSSRPARSAGARPSVRRLRQDLARALDRSRQRRMAGAPSCRIQNTADLEETAMTASPVYRATIQRHRSTKAEVEARREALLDIIEAGRPLIVRQVFYQASVRGLFEKAESGYVKLQTDLTLMRRVGEAPYD